MNGGDFCKDYVLVFTKSKRKVFLIAFVSWLKNNRTLSLLLK